MKELVIVLLLETSSMPATMEECMRARPDLGRPVHVISKQGRTNEPWHHRMCMWTTQPRRKQ